MNIRTAAEHQVPRIASYAERLGSSIKNFYRKRRAGLATGIGTLAMVGGLGAAGVAVGKSAVEVTDRITAITSEAMQPTHVQIQQARLKAASPPAMVPVSAEHQSWNIKDLSNGELGGIGILLIGVGGATALWGLRERSRTDSTPRRVTPATRHEPAPRATDEIPRLRGLFSDHYPLTLGQRATALAVGGMAGAGAYAHIQVEAASTKVHHEISSWRLLLEMQVQAGRQHPYNPFATSNVGNYDMPALDSPQLADKAGGIA